jgi:hypothetical protein
MSHRKRALAKKRATLRADDLHEVSVEDLRASVLEAEQQRRTRDAYERCGCTVVRLGGAHRWTPNERGVPDMLVWHTAKRLHWAHETKAVEVTAKGERRLGKQRPEQVRIQRLYEACTHGYVLGGVEEAVAFMERVGIIA